MLKFKREATLKDRSKRILTSSFAFAMLLGLGSAM